MSISNRNSVCKRDKYAHGQLFHPRIVNGLRPVCIWLVTDLGDFRWNDSCIFLAECNLDGSLSYRSNVIYLGTSNQHQYGQLMQQDPSNNVNQQQAQPQQANTYPRGLSSQPSYFPATMNQYGCQTMGPFQLAPYGQMPQHYSDPFCTTSGIRTPILVPQNNNVNIPLLPFQASQIYQSLQTNQAFPQVPRPPDNYSHLGTNYVPNQAPLYYPPTCRAYPIHLPAHTPLSHKYHWQKDKNGNYHPSLQQINGDSSQLGSSAACNTEGNNSDHCCCCPGIDGTVCSKPHCQSSINLQALVSQLLSIPGIIPCTVIRLILKRIPVSNITTTTEDMIAQAERVMDSLTKEQLIAENKNAEQMNVLINLHMTTNSSTHVIPLLTMIQLKVNSLKARVEKLISKHATDSHYVQLADGNINLDLKILKLKSDAQVRQLLSTLRQQECEERVNLNYAPYHSQRVIAETRLRNVHSKIRVVEIEMERRRNIAMPWNSAAQIQQGVLVRKASCHTIANYSETRRVNSPLESPAKISVDSHDSPSPFFLPAQNPKRLFLRPKQMDHFEITMENEQTRGCTCVMNKNRDTESRNDSIQLCNGLKTSEYDTCQPSKKLTEDVCNSCIKCRKKIQISIDEHGINIDEDRLEDSATETFGRDSSNVVIIIDKGQGQLCKTQETKNSITMNRADNNDSEVRKSRDCAVTSNDSHSTSSRSWDNNNYNRTKTKKRIKNKCSRNTKAKNELKTMFKKTNKSRNESDITKNDKSPNGIDDEYEAKYKKCSNSSSDDDCCGLNGI